MRDNWGGRPLDDILSLVQHLRQVPGADMDNAVIAGAGYGGYLMNWIQGHEIGRMVSSLDLLTQTLVTSPPTNDWHCYHNS